MGGDRGHVLRRRVDPDGRAGIGDQRQDRAVGEEGASGHGDDPHIGPAKADDVGDGERAAFGEEEIKYDEVVILALHRDDRAVLAGDDIGREPVAFQMTLPDPSDAAVVGDDEDPGGGAGRAIRRYRYVQPHHRGATLADIEQLLHSETLVTQTPNMQTAQPRGVPRLTSAATITWVTVCDTCRREDRPKSAHRTDGERLADAIEAAAGGTGVAVRRFSCLMGCQGACNVTVQAAGKIGYTLGRFEPDAEAAAGIVRWATLHAQSPTGIVPYRGWPAVVKGHFVTRHPPLPDTRAAE